MDVAPPREEGGDEDDVDDDGRERRREVTPHPVQGGAEDRGDADERQVGEHDAQERRHDPGFRVVGQEVGDADAGGGEESEEEGEGGDQATQERARFLGLSPFIAFDERGQERGGEGAFAEQSPEEVGGAERDGERPMSRTPKYRVQSMSRTNRGIRAGGCTLTTPAER
jgi:hypothetical protein